jgi:Fe-S cluster biogenesis protein NfuA
VPEARAHTRAIVQALLDLHALGLERALAHVRAAGEAGRALLDAWATDEAVSGLLLLHGLHPLGLTERVQGALDALGPRLRGHGGSVELLGIQDGVVRVLLHGSCDGGAKQAVEEMIYAKAPEVVAVEVEGETAPPPDGRVALPLLGA